MNRISKKVVLICCLVTLLLGSGNLITAASEDLRPLLVNLKGWQADDAEVNNINMGAIKLLTGTKSYSQENSSFDVTVLAGSNALVEGQTSSMNVETDGAMAKTSTIDGFTVSQGFDKNDKSGYILISLNKGEQSGSLVSFGYSGITPEKALELAKKFDWKKLKNATKGMVD